MLESLRLCKNKNRDVEEYIAEVTKKIETQAITQVVTNESIEQLRNRCREVIKAKCETRNKPTIFDIYFNLPFLPLDSVVSHQGPYLFYCDAMLNQFPYYNISVDLGLLIFKDIN